MVWIEHQNVLKHTPVWHGAMRDPGIGSGLQWLEAYRCCAELRWELSAKTPCLIRRPLWTPRAMESF